MQIQQVNVEEAIGRYVPDFGGIEREIAHWQEELSQAAREAGLYRTRSRLLELAVGLFDGLAGGLLALSAVWLLQGNYSFALGVLGAALASLVGVVGFRLKRRTLGS